MNLFGVYYPGQSFWHGLDPRSKIIWVLGIMIWLFAAGFWPVVGALAFLFGLHLSSGLPAALWLKPVGQFKWLLLVTFLLNLVIPWREGGLLETLGANGPAALLVALRLAALFAVAAWLTFTTQPLRLVDGLAKLFKPLNPLLRKIDLPLIMSLVLRFIPEIYQESENIIMAQRVRGAGKPLSWRDGSLWVRCTVIPLFVASIRKSAQTAIAMEARGYRIGLARTALTELKLRPADLIVMGAAGLIIASAIWLGWAHGG
jgi:energy-coupling factor transport system permease protein